MKSPIDLEISFNFIEKNMKNLLVIRLKKCENIFLFCLYMEYPEYFIFFHFPGGKRVSPI